MELRELSGGRPGCYTLRPMVRRSRRPSSPRPPPTRPRGRLVDLVLLAVVVVAAQWEIFRLGFFADDFHFLDVGLRPFGLDLLLGRDGIHPWYRPLLRELPFLALP